MEQLRLFAVSSVTKPPVELERKKDKQIFTCSLILPIPTQLLIFSQGQWPPGKDKSVTLDIYLDSNKIGEMNENSRCFTWEADSLKDRPAGDKMLLKIKVIGMKTPTEECQVPKTRKGSVSKKTDKTSSQERKGKASSAQGQEHKPLVDISEKVNTDSEKMDEVTSKIPEKLKGAESPLKADPNSGKKEQEKKKKNNTRTTEKRKSVSLTTGMKKTRQTQLNFSGAKKVLPVSEAQNQYDEQGERSKDEDVSDLQAVEKKVELTEIQGEPEKGSSPVKTCLDEDGWGEAQVLNENTPQMAADMPSPLPRKPMKKRRRGNVENSHDGPTPKKQGTRMRALNSEGAPKSSRSKKAILADSPFKENLTTPVQDVKASEHSEGRLTRCVDLSARAPRPSARWGHTMLLGRPGCAVLIGGQGDRQQLSRDSVWMLNTETRKWQCQEVQSEGQKPENRMGHSATYDPTMRCIYIFGGSKNSRWFHDVHVYDLVENKWSLTKVEGKAPTRAYHTANLHRHELWIFGGVYPRPDPNPDGCSNDIHIFSPVMQSWYLPIVQGEKPLPRSGHSATLIKDRLVMFGGWDAPFCYNDLFILDMTTVDWSKPDVKGTPPKPRSWHASCALTNERILIHGGYDGNEALEDSFIFDLGGLSWSRLVMPNAPKARAGHAAVCIPYSYENQEEDDVLVFGGGDNDGEFFSDLLAFAIPFNPVVQL